MARIRTVKPEFFADENLGCSSAHARLLAIALMQLCDANGVFRYVPMQIHAHAFPWEASVNTQVLLGELEAIGYVKFFRHKGKEYGYVSGFVKHQRLTGKEAQSGGQFPKIEQAEQEFSLWVEAGKHPDVSRGSIQMSRKEEQGKRKEEQGSTPSGGPQAAPDEKMVFDRARNMLGKSGASLAGKLRKKFEYDDPKVYQILQEAEGKSDPTQWLGAVIAGRSTPRAETFPDAIYRNVL